MASEIILYHNPRCSKSREALALLEARGAIVTVVEYLKNPLSEAKLLEIAQKLPSPAQLVRTSEDTYDGFPTDDARVVAAALARQPVLMQRPLAVTNKGAIVGRPPELVLRLMD